MAEKRTYVKRIIVGRPVRSINQAASGVVSGTGRQFGSILVNKTSTNLYEPGELVAGHGLDKSFGDSNSNNIVLSLDSSELKAIIDSDYVKLITGQSTLNFVDSAYVEANSLDSERGLNLFRSDLSNLTTSIVPNADSSIDLGSSTKKFRKLFLSGNTIVLGNLTLGAEGGTLAVRDSSGTIAPVDISGNTTSDLAEGTRLYYTRSRFDSALGDATSTQTIRNYFSFSDQGGDGSFSYDSSTGVFTYIGPSAAEVRAHLNGGHGIIYSTSTGNISVDSQVIRGLISASGDLTYNSSTGQFSIDVEQVYSKANFDSDLGAANTGQLPEGSNLYYTEARVTTLVDSAYIQARQQLVDSASIIALVDSNYIANRIGGPFIDSDYFDTNVPKLGTDYVDSAEVEGIISNKIGATLFPHDSNLKAFADAFTLPTSDGSSAQALATNGSGTLQFVTLGGVSDSASTIALIDSNYVRLRVPTNQDLRTTDSVTFSGLTVTGNAVVDGNLTINGDTVTVSASTLSVNDPLIHLADSNETSDTLDIGFIGHYYRDAQRRHTGLFRDASDDQYYLFRHMIDSAFDSTQPPSTINRSATDFTKADLNIGRLIADSATLTNITRAATVDSGTYGSATLIPQITVNTSGFIDSIGTVAVASISSTTWDSSTGEYTISTADGGSFKTAIRGFGDNVSLAFGNENDAIINRNPSNLVIKDSTGGIYIEAQDIYLASKNNGNPIWLQVGADDGVKLNDSTGNLILKTRKYGVELNGSITGDSADFDIIRIGGKVIQSHIDSAYIELNSLDSERTINLIRNNALFVDSAYIELNSLDSERTIALIDSSYVNARVQDLTGDEFTFTLVDSGAIAGPRIVLDRNSSSPADSDALADIEFRGRNSADSSIQYGKIATFINNATANAEVGEMQFIIKQSGFERVKMKLNSQGVVLDNSESIVFSDDSNSQLLSPGNYTADHILTLPDSSGIILTRGFVTTIIDSAYVGARQGATGFSLGFDDSAGVEQVALTITQAPTIVTGAPIGFGNTVTLLDKDSAEVVVSL